MRFSLLLVLALLVCGTASARPPCGTCADGQCGLSRPMGAPIGVLRNAVHFVFRGSEKCVETSKIVTEEVVMKEKHKRRFFGGRKNRCK